MPLRRATLLLLVTGVLGLSAPHEPPNTTAPAPEDQNAAAATAAKIEPILAALKRGDNGAALEPFTKFEQAHPGEFERWLGRTLKKGKAHRQDVLLLFGHHFVNLDRPARDKVLTLQYELGDWHDMITLVFHFDADTGTLADRSISHAICGFCPHVFAYDGRWRLEGKMLAGRVGRQREGADTLLLPSLRLVDGRLRVKLANLAPEVEHLDQVQLGCLPLNDGEELDVAPDGSPVLWRARRAVGEPMHPTRPGGEGCCLDFDPPRESQVVVLEAFNTSRFETAMRERLLRPGGSPVSASLQVQFDRGATVEVPPVGTKFLRRVVAPVPVGIRSVRLSAPADLWYVRRLWTGSGRPVEKDVRWLSPSGGERPGQEAARLQTHAEGQRLRLDPGKEIEVTFAPEDGAAAGGRSGFILRMRGYYEFLARAPRSGTSPAGTVPWLGSWPGDGSMISGVTKKS
jgi:hypothetical protein